MALEIAYFDGAGSSMATNSVYGLLVSSASVTLSALSASCGTVPSGATLARLKAGEACRVSNNGSDASATNGILFATGDIIDMVIFPGTALNAQTV